MKYLRPVTFVLDVAAFGTLMLVPLAGPLGISDAEVPASAIAGLFYLAVPLFLAAVSIGAIMAGKVAADRSTLVGTAFWVCAVTVVLVSVMAIQAIVQSEAASIRGFSLIAVALFSLNVMVLRHSAFVWSPGGTAS